MRKLATRLSICRSRLRIPTGSLQPDRRQGFCAKLMCGSLLPKAVGTCWFSFLRCALRLYLGKHPLEDKEYQSRWNRQGAPKLG
jgi:hypothetical protein